MKSAEVFGWFKLIVSIIVLTLFFGLHGCKGSSSPDSGSSTGITSPEPGLNSPVEAQSGIDCNSSKIQATPDFVTGIIKYVDREFDSTGFTGTACKPVKFADVQVVRASDFEVIASGSTNSQGSYSINGSSFLGESVYVRALTLSNLTNKKITVKSDSSKAVYSVISNDFTFSGDGVVKELTVPVTSTAARPFNVFSVLMNGAIFVEAVTGAALTSGTTGFYPNSLDNGTYFSAPDLYICGGCSNDDDGWDDTVIMHEFGHFVASLYSKDDSGGGSHTLQGHFELPLTWSEGWATFFSSALRDFLGITSPEQYVDTNGVNGQGIGIQYEIETPASASQTIGADNEVAVSAVLWDIYDSVNEAGFDDISGGIGTSSAGIWDVFQNHLSTSEFVSLEDFWDGWFLRGNGTLSGLNDITSIFEARSVFYRADSAEPDDTSGSASFLTVGLPMTNGTPANNLTFYPSDDIDWFKFSYVQGKTYTVETLDLGDGADPVIELYTDPSASSVCSSDDISKTNVNARLTVPGVGSCTVSGTGTLYLKVFSSITPADPADPASPRNPAEYGNYNIRVTL